MSRVGKYIGNRLIDQEIKSEIAKACQEESSSVKPRDCMGSLLLRARRSSKGSFLANQINIYPNDDIHRLYTSWWFQPIKKILVKMDNFPR